MGYGAVILMSGQEVKRFSGAVEQYAEQRQVVGELQATMLVLQWCQEHTVEEIEIFMIMKASKNGRLATGKPTTRRLATMLLMSEKFPLK